jgi:hypothetical protein
VFAFGEAETFGTWIQSYSRAWTKPTLNHTSYCKSSTNISLLRRPRRPTARNNPSEALEEASSLYGAWRHLLVPSESNHLMRWNGRYVCFWRRHAHIKYRRRKEARGQKIDDGEAVTLAMMRSSSAFDCTRCIVFRDTRPMNSVNTATGNTVLPSISRRTKQFLRFCVLDALLERVGPSRSIVEIKVWAVHNVECRMVLTFLCWPRVALVVVVC